MIQKPGQQGKKVSITVEKQCERFKDISFLLKLSTPFTLQQFKTWESSGGDNPLSSYFQPLNGPMA
jgi:hypothetical protein